MSFQRVVTVLLHVSQPTSRTEVSSCFQTSRDKSPEHNKSGVASQLVVYMTHCGPLLFPNLDLSRNLSKRLFLCYISYYNCFIMSGQQSLNRFFSARKPEIVNSTSKKLISQKRTTETDYSPLKRTKNSTMLECGDLNSPHLAKVGYPDLEKDTVDSNILVEAESLLKLESKYHSDSPDLPQSQEIFYSSLTNIFEKLEQEPARLKNLAIASEFFLQILRSNHKRTLVEVIYLMINRLGPDYELDLELGLGETLLVKAIAEGTGRTPQRIRSELHKLGDIGLVAQNSRSRQPTMFKSKPLTIHSVFENLTKIAKSSGNASQARKIGLINQMLTTCEGSEAKFLMRSLEGKLRINFGEKSVLVALSKAFSEYEHELSSKKGHVSPQELVDAEEAIKKAFSQIPNYEIIVDEALKYGISNLATHCTLKPGIPLKPMLAKPTKSITEVLDHFHGQEFTCEYKYDGERAQLHVQEDGTVKIYSRNSEDMSQRYPDLIDVVSQIKTQCNGVITLILDCECVAWDGEKGKILPFQVLSTRKRKDVNAKDIKVQVCLFAFDILFLNGKSLLELPLKERRKILHENVKPIEGKFQFAEAMDADNVAEIQHFLDQSVKDSCEGLMVKMLDGDKSHYEPSKRSVNWLKLKKDYLEGVGDSLDLAVVGGYIGKGKRTGWYGGFLLACYNEDSGEYETCCKIGTGFSEEMLQTLSGTLKPTVIQQPKPFYVYDASPDVWFEPTLVFEVLTADLSLSPVYKAGINFFGKGVSLRFPRFIRVRDDKSPEQATSSDQIVELYQKQAHV
ncbi:GQ67_04253T0 [Komagataella phaffii]|nr:GQ67_04253T0 [Komagataella phaffii]AOA68248.1 GQ68_04225T0 [Komagataella phaffii GS115]